MPPPVLTQKGSPFKGPTMAMKSGCWSRANTALMRDCRPVSVPKWLEGNLSMRRGGGAVRRQVWPSPTQHPPADPQAPLSVRQAGWTGRALVTSGPLSWLLTPTISVTIASNPTSPRPTSSTNNPDSADLTGLLIYSFDKYSPRGHVKVQGRSTLNGTESPALVEGAFWWGRWQLDKEQDKCLERRLVIRAKERNRAEKAGVKGLPPDGQQRPH